MFLRKDANCLRMACMSPLNPRSPAIIWPMASAAAVMLSARNCDTCWSNCFMVLATFSDTYSRASENFHPLSVRASV